MVAVDPAHVDSQHAGRLDPVPAFAGRLDLPGNEEAGIEDGSAELGTSEVRPIVRCSWSIAR